VITCPDGISVECSESGGTPASDPLIQAFLAGAGATDICDPSPVITEDAPAFFLLGETVVTFTATDAAGNDTDCTATVTVVDTTPPEITVELNRYSLWPPNHKLVDICAEVTVTDICDPAPTFVLTSVTSDEPDDAPGVGDGSTVNDIQADVGTDDVKFQLRSERQGGGDGRKYTITYTAMDLSGNETPAVVCVVVPHDRRGGAMAAFGFSPTGTSFAEGSTEFTVVIQNPQFETIDASKVLVGNLQGFYGPTYHRWADVNDDGANDLVVRFDTQPALSYTEVSDPGINGDTIEISKSPSFDPISIRYSTLSGKGYLVADIFTLSHIEFVVEDSKRHLRTVAPLSEPGISASPDGLQLTLAEGGFVTVDVFSVQGRKVRTIVSQQMVAGTHALTWNGLTDMGTRVPGGVYFYRLIAPGFTQVQRVVRLQ
jgi:hypothetical protein